MALKRHSYLVRTTDKALFSPVLLDRFLNKMGDAVIQFSTTHLQNVLLYMPLTTP